MLEIMCGTCQVSFGEARRVGVRVIEQFCSPPQPYKIWRADKYQCPVCGNVVISGFGRLPESEHFNPNFEDVLEAAMSDPETVILYEKATDALKFG